MKVNFFFIYIVSLILLVSVSSSRFNKHDFFFPAFNHAVINDSRFYEAMVHYFRTSEVTGDFHSPFAYRPLAPKLASYLPFEALTSLNMLNVLFLCTGLFFLQLIIYHYFDSLKFIIIGNILFIFSFPLYYYSTIGLVDPVLIGFMLAGLYFIIRKKWWLSAFLFLPGILIKESYIILFPVMFLFMLQYKEKYPQILSSCILALFMICIATWYARAWSFVDGSYMWTFESHIFYNNLLRPRNWISLVLSLGIPGGVVIVGIIKSPLLIYKYYPLMAGFALGILLYMYAFIAAYSDGRFIWTAYPFIIPLAVIMYSRWIENMTFNKKVINPK